jgi:hypothetical protein
LEGEGMSVETDTRDRVIRLETEMGHMRAALEDFLERQAAQNKKLEEVHGVVAQAKGIGYFGLAMIPVAGAIGGFLTWLGIKINVSI